MPKKASVTKEMIISVAIDIVQKGESLNGVRLQTNSAVPFNPYFTTLPLWTS